ncbi:MAG: translation elongation factor Ts [Clostridia bacterium]|nr:translation elongation factor Ts [Clostridia bacterium]
MAAVTAALVKELRDATGAGMMDCKKALVATDGDMDKAVDYLRENGLAKAAKKSGRIASEGLVRMAFAADGTAASAVEVNSETDFVAKNEEFVEFVEKLADIALAADKACAECLKDMAYGEEGTVAEVLTAKIAKIGENMNLRRAVKCNTPGVKYVGYSHGGGRIGVIIGLKTDASVEEVTVCGKDVAMQAASMRPLYVDEAGVDPEYLAHEKEVILAQAMNENNELPENKRKPQAIIEKMITGRVKKSLKEVCLVDQAFVKDSNMTVGEYVASCAKALGKPIQVVEMVRYEVGEGLEKKVENFAEEVAKQMQA